MQDVTMEGNVSNGKWNFSILFLIIVRKSTTISEFKIKKH